MKYNESRTLQCDVTSLPKSTIYRWKINLSPKPRVFSTRNSTILYIIKSVQDYGLIYCWAKNALGWQEQACKISTFKVGMYDKILSMFLNCNVFSHFPNLSECALLTKSRTGSPKICQINRSRKLTWSFIMIVFLP